MCTVLLLSAVTGLLVGCAPAPGGGEVIRYLALGDSYTIGHDVEPADRWPVQLAAALRQEGYEVEPPLIVARTGWVTHELLAAIDEVEEQAPFDLVSLLIGVNNQYRGRDAEEYRSQFRTLLERAIGFAGGGVGIEVGRSAGRGPSWRHSVSARGGAGVSSSR